LLTPRDKPGCNLETANDEKGVLKMNMGKHRNETECSFTS